jgi:Tfp pilus assembly protein PilO
MGQVSDAKDELAAAEAQQSTLEVQLAALEQAEIEAPENRAIIQEVDDQIPPTADESGFLLLIKKAASEASVNLTTLTPAVPALDPVTGLSVISVAISADGTYFSIAEFLYNLETLPRAAKVQNTSLTPLSDSSGGATISTTNLQLQASVVLFTSDTSAGPGSIPGPSEPTTAPATPTPAAGG